MAEQSLFQERKPCRGFRKSGHLRQPWRDTCHVLQRTGYGGDHRRRCAVRSSDRNRAESFVTVLNGTERLPLRCQNGSMLHKKTKKESGNAILTSVTKEMAKPRTAKSARIAELNLDSSRIRVQPSITVPAVIEEIIAFPGPGQREKAQIAIEEADRHYRNLRIDNTLTDENGDDVSLKKGAHVEITVTAKPGNIKYGKPILD